MKILRALVPLFAFALIGCGDDDPSGPSGSDYRFEVNVTGDMEAMLEGSAYFGEDRGPDDEPIFAILLMHDDGEQMVLLAKEGSERPAVGTYQISSTRGEGTWAASLMSTEGEDLLGFFLGESGTLTITESSTTRVRGHVTFAGEGFIGEDFESPAAVTVAGDFEARRISGQLPGRPF